MYLQRGLLPQAKKIRASPTLPREAKRRLRWMEYYLSHGRNAKLTYRHFGISSATFYRLWHRYDPRRLERLEDDWGTGRRLAVRESETAPGRTIIFQPLEGPRMVPMSAATQGRRADAKMAAGKS